MEKKMVTSVSCHTFSVDTSLSTCARFGVRAGASYYHPSLGHGTVVGVARMMEWEAVEKGDETVWVAFEADRGKVSNILPPKKTRA